MENDANLTDTQLQSRVVNKEYISAEIGPTISICFGMILLMNGEQLLCP